MFARLSPNRAEDVHTSSSNVLILLNSPAVSAQYRLVTEVDVG